MTQQQAEEALRAEGLTPLAPKSALSAKFRSMTGTEIDAHIAAVATWQRWAADVLETFVFVNDHQREIWRSYAEGTPTRKIASTLPPGPRGACRSGCGRFVAGRAASRAQIERVIATIKSHYPDAPRNPWSSTNNKQEKQ